jgi:folate-binding protein YgfZ
MALVAGWDDSPKPDVAGPVGDDPRLAALGWRAVVARGKAADLGSASYDAYHAHRIALGVPEAGKDFSLGDAFPHEALMDQLHGIDFDKGCYVGQEVVSRMQHRGTARTRIVPLVYLEGSAAEPGAEVAAGARSLGRTGSAADGRGLAMIRLDRAADALAAGEAILAGGHPVRLERPAWATFSVPAAAATSAA